jgi:predicted dehydrogenase
MADTLRVGVLGAGWAGEAHVAAYSRLPGVEVTGLWNRTKMRAEALASKLGYADLTVYDDWQSLIGAGSCDVISIATAPMLRSDPLLAALDQGCHVLVEKPVSVGVQEARVMAAAAEATNTSLQVVSTGDTRPPTRQLRRQSAQAKSALYATCVSRATSARAAKPLSTARGERGWTSPTELWVKACLTTSTRLDTSLEKSSCP